MYEREREREGGPGSANPNTDVTNPQSIVLVTADKTRVSGRQSKRWPQLPSSQKGFCIHLKKTRLTLLAFSFTIFSALFCIMSPSPKLISLPLSPTYMHWLLASPYQVFKSNLFLPYNCVHCFYSFG
jgi:hypothetical protein